MPNCPYSLPAFRFNAQENHLKLSGAFYLPKGPELLKRMADLIGLHQLTRLKLDVCFNRLDKSSQSQLEALLELLEQHQIDTDFCWYYVEGRAAASLIDDPRFSRFKGVRFQAKPVGEQVCQMCHDFDKGSSS